MKLAGYRITSHGSLEAVTLATQRAEKRDQGSEPGRSTDFRAVEGSGESMSGETLLVEAYAAVWIILLGFVLVSWRRQARIDARVAELEQAISRGRSK